MGQQCQEGFVGDPDAALMEVRVNLADTQGTRRLSQQVSHEGAKGDEVADAMPFGHVPEDNRIDVALQQVDPMRWLPYGNTVPRDAANSRKLKGVKTVSSALPRMVGVTSRLNIRADEPLIRSSTFPLPAE